MSLDSVRVDIEYISQQSYTLSFISMCKLSK